MQPNLQLQMLMGHQTTKPTSTVIPELSGDNYDVGQPYNPMVFLLKNEQFYWIYSCVKLAVESVHTPTGSLLLPAIVTIRVFRQED